MTDDPIKRSDQITTLKACAHFTETGEWQPFFSYPNCGWHLVQMGLVTEDKKITDAGRAALYLLKEGPDPLDGEQSFVSFQLPLKAAS